MYNIQTDHMIVMIDMISMIEEEMIEEIVMINMIEKIVTTEMIEITKNQDMIMILAIIVKELDISHSK